MTRQRQPLPIGPWTNEPNHVEWKHAGLTCLIHRNGMGALCGYVGVPPNHPLHGKSYDDVDLDVHGGLTYSAECQGEICHKPAPGEVEHLFWFGFDCAHGGDLIPSMHARYGSDGDVYRDVAYVTAQANGLAEQLAAMMPSDTYPFIAERIARVELS